MALKDFFKSKSQKQEDEKKMNVLRFLVYMALCDDNITAEEIAMIQNIMSLRKGMSKEESLEEIKSMVKSGFNGTLKGPETQEEKDELFCFLASEMLIDHKIEQQEWEFLILVVKTMYKVDDKTAQDMMNNMCRKLIETGGFWVNEVNVK